MLFWIDRVWSSKECVCCAYDSSVHLDSICSFHRFCLCLYMSYVISSFKSLKAGSKVFALFMLFLFVIWHSMWSGMSLQLLCILPYGILYLSVIRLDMTLRGCVISIYCVGFASIDIVCDAFYDCTRNPDL